MSLSIKKFFSALVLSVAVLSLALSASAQAIGLPEVYVKDLYLEQSEYKAGDTVTGNFTLWNAGGTTVSNVYYMILLMGDYKDSLPQIQYDNSAMQGPFDLSAGERRTVNFSYNTPVAVGGDGLGIQVRALLDNGASMGWADASVKITGGTGFLSITNSNLTIGKSTFTLQEGPTIQNGEKAFLNLTLKNPTASKIDFTPTVKIFNRSEARGLLKSFTEKPVSVIPKGEVKLSVELPTFDNAPKVYFGQITFPDSAGVARAAKVDFRYIVYGDIVTINGVTSDKTAVNQGETYSVTVSYSGTPIDIRGVASSTKNEAELILKVYNEKDLLVTDFSKVINFNQGSFGKVTGAALVKAKALRAEVQVMEDGKTLASYEAKLSANYDEKKIEKDSWTDQLTPRIMVLAVIALIILLSLIFIKVVLAHKGLMVTVILVILALLIGYFAMNQADAWVQDSYTSAGDGQIYNVFVNSPAGEYGKGKAFYLQVSASAQACGNHGRYFTLSSTYEGVSKTTSVHRAQDYTNPPPLTFSSYNLGPFYTPSTVGSYSIPFKLEISYDGGDDGNWAILTGHQNFSVVSIIPAPSGLKATCPAPGANATLSWNPVEDATGYLVRVDNQPNSFQEDCSKTWNEGDKCYATPHLANNLDFSGTRLSFNSTSTAGKNTYKWWVVALKGETKSTASYGTFTCSATTPSAPLSVSCSYTATNGSVAPSTVTWTASATGGTSPYTYSWTGSDGLAGNTSSVSKLYSSAGVYFATTTVRDSASTTLIVSCPGTLSNAGSPGDTVIGGCTSNCGKTIVSGAIAGVCGGADGLSFADATALNSANLCYYQGSVATPSSFSGNGPWSWTCSGINGSATSSPTCTATKSAVSDPSLNCTFGTKASSTVNVNTNTVWTVNPPACSTCTRTWSIIEGTQNNPPNGTVSGNTINHIFTTIGLKEVRVTFSTTTGGIPRSGSCTATTTVVQTGGGTQEI